MDYSAIRQAMGDIPEDWRWVPIESVINERRVRARDVSGGLDLPVLSLTKDRGLIPQTERFDHRVAVADVSNYKVVEPTWIAYNPMVIWEGAIWGLEGNRPGLVSPVYAIWAVDDGVADWAFLDLLLRTPMVLREYERLCSGVVKRRRTLKKDQFLDIEIPLPPLPEQRAIARVLRAVQRAKEATEQVIAAARELKKSLMRHLFTYGPVPPESAGWTALRETNSLPVRSDWRTVSLDEAADWFSGGTPSTSNREYWDGDIPWISSSSLTTFYLKDSHRHVTAVGVENGTRIVPPGTTLVVVRGMSLRKEWRVGVATRDLAFGQDCKALRPKGDLDPTYFAYAVKAQEPVVLTMVDRSGHGTGRLSTDRLRSVEIPAIPREEQQVMVGALQGVDRKIAAEEAYRDALATLFDSLLHDLMTARLRVTDLEVV